MPALASALAEGTPTTKAALAPVNTGAPTLTGTPALGQTLNCSTGTWANSPTSFSYAWLRSGVPIAGQTAATYVVQAADEGHTISCQVTAANGGGSYTITGLASGSYKIDFYPEEGVNELSQYYNGTPTEAGATPVAVTAPTTTSGVNAELHAGGQIEGRVTAAATHIPVANVFACAEEASPKPLNGKCALTNANGEYVDAGLPGGSYTIEFFALFEGGYLTQYYSGESTLGEAKAVGVTVGTTVSGVNAELQSSDQGGQITGTITKAGGPQEIAGIEVCAFELSEISFVDKCAVSDSKGSYTISGLAEGSYSVSFLSKNCQVTPCTTQNYITQYYNGVAFYSEATPVPVLANNITPGINAKMVEGGQVEGRVVSAAGGEVPLPNVFVCAESGSSFGNCVETNANGEYKIEGLPTSTSYTLSFNADSGNYLGQTVENQSITAGAPPLKETEVKLLTGGEISGRVTGTPSHGPLEKAEVCADSSGVPGNCATTNSNGEYTIVALSSATYSVSFYPEYESSYLSQVQAGVSVTAGSGTLGINAELQPGGQITGLVTDASTHAGVAKVEVCAANSTGEKCISTETGAASASAASNLLTVPGGGFTLKKVSFDSKSDDLDFFFNFPTAGKLTWGLFFKNADVGFADSLGLSLQANGVAADAASTQTIAEAARKHKSKGCKKGTIKHHGKCAHLLVPFAAGSQSVAAGSVEVKIHAGSKAIRALKAGRTLHVSGTFVFQSVFGGPAIAKQESAVVRLPKKHSRGHKGKRR
ncbi:MAG TPA: carboxypeptidase-like regulatory domain-containing protein [Solirubrobacteraceae bacterium]